MNHHGSRLTSCEVVDRIDCLSCLTLGPPDELSPEALLDLLPAHLQEQFLSSLDTPEPSALLQSLLDSEELALDADRPWWLPVEDDTDAAGFVTRKAKRRDPPPMMTLPKEVLMMGISEEMGERMVYNVLAVA